MSDRVYVSIFYVVLIIGSSWTAVSLGEMLARDALTNLALLPSSNARPSRVDAYLAANERIPEPKDVRQPLVPAAPSVTVGALAKAMDDAEHGQSETTNNEGSATSTAIPAVVPEAEKPRVAGWVKRLPKRAVPENEETSGRIIMRSLRAEM
ncbi:MAG: hypothetical protein QM780_17940 [Hyphomicrobium sp.]|uniref:hypothetical protein n=1 Tax=Hyphomicrobium sp. TaxID=82 RepID=UPI0039E429D2